MQQELYLDPSKYYNFGVFKYDTAWHQQLGGIKNHSGSGGHLGKSLYRNTM